MCSVCGGRRAAEASPVRCVGERITATGVPEFREVAWRACASLFLALSVISGVVDSTYKKHGYSLSYAVSPGRADSLQKAQGNLPIRSAR
ncbi:hypothetical protein [Bathymodiolus japonicus methanotrophic gill symbiont]|uniref:hypothetical protein n=1 Tax=Bathymodiolus japonicus methanotrophic gill symbiont TaxID=113269 RepID=UPI001C8EFE75|nr:hypothetical protein [Bathymodiolus japonicus methanotrophic gill symbiont]